MSELSYGWERTLRNETFDGAVRKVTEAFRREGFGVLTEIDVRQTLSPDEVVYLGETADARD